LFVSERQDKELIRLRSLTIPIKVPIVKEVGPGILLDQVVLDCRDYGGESQDESKENS
jgi:hypothetical protein